MKGNSLKNHAVLQQIMLNMQQSIVEKSNNQQEERKKEEKMPKNVNLKLAWKLLYI